MADIIEQEATQEDSWSPFAGLQTYEEGIKTQVEPDDAPVPPQVQKASEDKDAAPKEEGALETKPVPDGGQELFEEAKEGEEEEKDKVGVEAEDQPQRGRKPMTAEDYEAKQINALYDVFVEDYNWKDIPEEQRPKSAREFCEFVTAVIAQNQVPKYANEELQALDQYVRNGGQVADYLRRVADVNYDALTINTEQNQKYAVAEFLRLQGFPPEAITRKVENYAKSGVLAAEAQDALAVLQGYSQQTRQQELQKQQQELQQTQEFTRNFIGATAQVLGGMKEVFGVPLTHRDKAELFSYIFDRDQNGNSQYMLDYSASPQAIIQSAFLTRYGKGVLTKAQQQGERRAMDKFRDTIAQQQIRSRGQARGSAPPRSGQNKVKQITDAFKI